MALDFNGSSNYASLASVGANNVHTIMAWVKFDGVSGYHNLYYHFDGNAGQSDGAALEWWDTAAHTGSTTLATGTWYHVAFVINGTSVTVYLNGASEITATTTNRGATYTLYFGAWGGSSDYLDGALACVRVWNGTALSQAQVQTEKGSASAVVTSNLYGDWALDSALTDASGNGRTLSFNGTPSYVAGPSFGGGISAPLIASTTTLFAHQIAFGAWPGGAPLWDKRWRAPLLAPRFTRSALTKQAGDADELLVAAFMAATGATLSAPLLAATSELYAATVAAGAVALAAPLLSSTETLYAPTVSAAGGTQTLTPPLLASTAALYAPTVGTGAVALAPPLIAASSALYAPVITAGSVALGAPQVASTATLYAPSLGTATLNWNVQVGDGYTDVSPKQIVRTKGNVLYTVAPNCDSYPDFSADGLTQTIRVHKANSTGVPTGFTRKDSTHEPAAVSGVAAALDSSDNIRIVWTARSSVSNTRYLRYAVFDTASDTWGSVTTIASDLDNPEFGQGDQTCALAVDDSDVCHVVYLGTAGSGALSDRRVYYRNNSGGSWSSATQVDTGVSYTGNMLAWHANIVVDGAGRRWVLWGRGFWNNTGDTTIYSRVYSGGAWGSTVQVSAETSTLETGIDQSTSMLITPDGRWHTAHIIHNTDNALKYIKYRYSDDQGGTWSGNNPSNQATHNPALAWTGGKVRIYGHGAPDSGNHGNNLYYMEGDGGSGSWGSWTKIVDSTHYDCSINVRWAVYNYHYPHTQDIAYWNDAYPNVLYVGTDIFALDLAAPLLASGAQLYAPTVATGGATLSPPLIVAAGALYAPVVAVGGVVLGAPLLAATSALYAPIVGVGYALAAPQIASGAQVFAPAVGVSYALSAPLIAAAAQTYAPTVAAGVATVAPPLLAASITLYAPVVSGGGVTLSVPLLASSMALFAPAAAAGGVSIAPPLLSSGAVIYAPTVGGSYALSAPLLTVSVALYAPAVSGGGVTLAPPFVASALVLYTPTIVPESVALTAPFVGSTALLYAPTIATAGAALVVPLLDLAAQLFAPILASGSVALQMPRLEGQTQVFAPWVMLLGIVTPAGRVFVVMADGRVLYAAAERRTTNVAAESRTYTMET